MSDEREIESFEEWILCGSGDNTFVGKLVGSPKLFASEADDMTGTSHELPHTIRLFPCYKQTLHVIPVQVSDPRTGRTAGVNLVQQESVASPSGAPFDLEVTITPSWISALDPSRPDPNGTYRRHFTEHVKRIVLAARQMQLKLRSAAAGLQT